MCNAWSWEQGFTIALWALISLYPTKCGNSFQINTTTTTTIITNNNKAWNHSHKGKLFCWAVLLPEKSRICCLDCSHPVSTIEDKINVTFSQVSSGIRQNDSNECLSSLYHIFQLALPVLYGNRWCIFLPIESTDSPLYWRLCY